MEASYDNFIGIYKNAVSADTCNKLINYFEEMNSLHRSYNRQESEGILSTVKKDEAINCGAPNTFNDNPSLVVGNNDPTAIVVQEELSQCLQHYASTYDTLQHYSLMAFYHKLQKTVPGGGYHIWHCEQGSGAQMRRVLVYTLYLNDVKEGGETEFLYQHMRVPAERGTVCIFPAHFTHPHRGNPPYSNEKYIMTGWVESVDIPDNMQLIPK